MRSAILSWASLLLVACGGKGTVDLGANGASAGWSDTRGNGVAGAASALAVAVPETLYDGGEAVTAIAVDGDTFAARIESQLETECRSRIDVCDLRDCKGTIKTIHSYVGCDYEPRATLIISHGEILWGVLGVDSTHADRIMACPIEGCSNGPRQVALGLTGYSLGYTTGNLVANADNVYWTEVRDTQEGIARCPRSGCVSEGFKAFPSDLRLFEYENGPTRLLSDEPNRMIYVQRGRAIARIDAELATEASLFYQDTMPLGGLALVGEYLYFTVSSLIGGVRRCPTSGCDQGSELVVDAPRWPSNFVADDRAMYWMHKADSGRISPGSGGSEGDSDSAAISSSPIHGSSGARLLVPTFQAYTYGTGSWTCGPVINAHHVYWCDVVDMKGSFHTLNIRMLAR